MIPLLIPIIAGAASTLLGTAGALFYGKNKLNKERVNHQEERSRLQKQIDELLKKIAEKDKIILALTKKIKELDEEKLEETRKRHQLVELIAKLEERQRALESILNVFIAFITFRFGKWKNDKIELKKALEKANNDESLIEALLEKIENERISFETQMLDETNQRDKLVEDRKELSAEIEKLDSFYV